MKGLILISAVLIHCSWSYASPGAESSKAFAYVDTSGNRYECVYKPQTNTGANHQSPNINKFNEITPSYKHWQVKRFLPPLPPLPPLRPFRPFRPFPPLGLPFHLFPPLPSLQPFSLRDIFGNIENQQRAAFEAAQSSFDAFNSFPYIPNFDFRFPSFHHYGMSGSNSAFAAGAVGPGFRRQVAEINPANPMMPNVDRRFYSQPNPSGNDFYSVSSSSYSSSVNDNGQVQSQRGAETVVNDRGQVTRYSVHS